MDPQVAVVIDDDPDVRDVVATILENDGFRVVACADGPAGVRAVEEHRPILITCDIHMPGMDGYAVVKRIRSFDDTYVIMISSLSDEIDIVSALEAGADDYLTKPFSPRELRARVHAMLRRSTATVVDTGPDLTAPGQPVLPAPASLPAPAPWPEPEPWLESEPAPVEAPPAPSAWISHQGLDLHPATGTALLHDVPLALSPVELGLLLALATNLGATCPAADLRTALGIEQPELEQAMVSLHRRLGPGWIVVVPGVGLRMRG